MSTSTITIRPFDTEKDYPAIVALSNTLWPEYEGTEKERRFGDTSKAERVKWGRFVAEQDGKVVGAAGYSHGNHGYHPQKFNIELDVYPDYQRQGIGTRLYQTLLEAIQPYNPIEVATYAREDIASGMGFLRKFGFEEAMREWESRLNMADFDTSLLQGAADKVAASGIEIFSYAELADDPNRDQKLYELDSAIMIDIPSTSEVVEIGMETFLKQYMNAPNFLSDAYFIAKDGEKYVGESVLWRVDVGDYLDTGATGVLREYRGRGIASALKLHALLYARKKNIPEVRTWNAQKNKEMLAINEKVGFVKQPAWIEFKKEIVAKI
jgi:mycothiol synthase